MTDEHRPAFTEIVFHVEHPPTRAGNPMYCVRSVDDRSDRGIFGYIAPCKGSENRFSGLTPQGTVMKGCEFEAFGVVLAEVVKRAIIASVSDEGF